MTETDMRHLEYMQGVADEDVSELRRKEATYKGSWKKRGGVGTFMMLARKWDRLEEMCKRRHFDIFEQVGKGEDGTMLAEIRDLRRYLVLVEAELQSRGVVESHSDDVGKAKRNLMHGIGGTVGGRTSNTTPNHEEVSRPEINRPRMSRPEVGRPGTPDDGGHHAPRTEPWVVGPGSREWSDNEMGIWYRRVAANAWVLEPFVDESATIPDKLKSIYKNYLPQGWIIDLAQCPPSLRGCFPVLQEEVNHFELGQLPNWQRALYDWHSDADKYIVRYREWCQLEEAA